MYARTNRYCNERRFRTNYVRSSIPHSVCVCVYSRYCDKATGCTVRGSKPGRDKRFSCSPKRQNRLWGPPSHLFDWMPRFFPARKLPGRDVDQSPLFSIEVKDKWSYTSAPPIFFHGLDRYILFRTSGLSCSFFLTEQPNSGCSV